MFGLASHKGAINAALLPAGPLQEQRDGCMRLCQGHIQELEEDFSAAVWLLLSGEGEQSQALKPLRPASCRQLCELGQVFWL